MRFLWGYVVILGVGWVILGAWVVLGVYECLRMIIHGCHHHLFSLLQLIGCVFSAGWPHTWLYAGNEAGIFPHNGAGTEIPHSGDGESPRGREQGMESPCPSLPRSPDGNHRICLISTGQNLGTVTIVQRN